MLFSYKRPGIAIEIALSYRFRKKHKHTLSGFTIYWKRNLKSYRVLLDYGHEPKSPRELAKMFINMLPKDF